MKAGGKELRLETHRLKTCATGDGGHTQVDNLCYSSPERERQRIKKPTPQRSDGRATGSA